MKLFLLISILSSSIIATSAYSADEDPLEVALCGKKDEILSAAEEKQKLEGLEPELPPVTSQTGTEWCSSFQSCDLLNYMIHLDYRKRGLPAEYKPSNMVSPIDAVYLSKRFLQELQDNSGPRKPIQLEMAERGTSQDILRSIQKSSIVRSQEQIPFNSLATSDPMKIELMEKLLVRYNAQHPEVVQDLELNGVSCSQGAINSLNSFEMINQWLFEMDRALGNENHPDIIKNYDEIAKEKGAPDLRIPPYHYRGFLSNSKIDFLNRVKQNLKRGFPMEIGVCTNGFIEPVEKASIKDPCGSHAMLLVGAGYQDGTCKVRLKNSWGRDWKDDGYISVSVHDLLNSMKRVMDGRYLVDWIEPSDKFDETFETENLLWSRKIGSKYSGTLTHDKKLKDGVLKLPDESSVIFENGTIAGYKNYPVGDPGCRYTGTLKDEKYIDNGSLTCPDGSKTIYKNGIPTSE